MKTEKNINLTEKETETLKSISEALLEELRASKRKSTTVELLETYSKELDLGGNSSGLAEEVAEELVKSPSLSNLYENGLLLVKVVYEEGIRGCEELLKKYSLRGMWDSIKDRKETLESTLQKVYSRMESLGKVFDDGSRLELQEEIKKPRLDNGATQDRIRVYAQLAKVLEEAAGHLEEADWYKEEFYPMGASDFILDASLQLSELLNTTEVTEQDFIDAGYPELWKSFQEDLLS